MRKGNVFLVTGRRSQATPTGPEARGELLQRVVCAANEAALHEYLPAAFPGFVVVGVVNLAALEETVGRIMAALSKAEGALPLFVDPAMSR